VARPRRAVPCLGRARLAFAPASAASALPSGTPSSRAAAPRQAPGRRSPNPARTRRDLAPAPGSFFRVDRSAFSPRSLPALYRRLMQELERAPILSTPASAPPVLTASLGGRIERAILTVDSHRIGGGVPPSPRITRVAAGGEVDREHPAAPSRRGLLQLHRRRVSRLVGPILRRSAAGPAPGFRSIAPSAKPDWAAAPGGRGTGGAVCVTEVST